MRLIDADALMGQMRRMPIFEKRDFDRGMLYVEKSIIDSMPTIDAEPVVRCKDCDKSKPSNMCGAGWCFCKNNFQHHKEDHFCSYGERREEDG